jgi:hypothetical protein
MGLEEIRLGELRWALLCAPDGATLGEALEQLEAARRQELADLAHGALVSAYSEYAQIRREGEHAAVQGAYSEAKKAELERGPVSRERLHLVAAEAADVARLRHELGEPLLQFDEWVPAGEPRIHRTRGADNILARGVSH